ncbi:MAG TPA: hypothetical protein VEO95_04770 [Chthoniobacteraceae bacterium]|nr:hypothetical protein [Chthoniobacteraceae bacterium]
MNDFESDDLSAKLRTWQVKPAVPGSFQREVWQRIATRQAAREDAFLPRLWQAVSALLTRPRYALALIALGCSISIGVAHVQAQEARAKHWKTLEARYAVSVDPLAMAR